MTVSAYAGGSLRFTLAVNSDGTYDTTYPNGDKPPNGPTLACNDAGAPSLSGLQTGTAYSANVRQYFSGTAAATATLSVVNVPGSTTDATTQWSISSAGAGNNLVNAGSATGSGSLKIRGTTGGQSVDCSVRVWSYVNPPSTDTTPPITVTGVHVDSTGVGTVTISADASMDPDQGVQRKGVSTYRFKRNGTTVDTLAADPGIVCPFAGTAIGSPMGSLSATQGTGATGGKWTLVTGGTGNSPSVNDDEYGIYCSVAGSLVYVIDRIDSIGNVKTYNESFSEVRSSTSASAAKFGCKITFVSPSTVYTNYVLRPSDGASDSQSSLATIAATFPIYRRTIVNNNVGSCDYSFDGGDWHNWAQGVPITLPTNKVAGVAGAATTTGSDEANLTIVEGEVGVQIVGRISKTLTVAAGSATYTTTAIDLATTPNESAAVAGVVATPGSAGGQVKFHQSGAYVNPAEAVSTFLSSHCSDHAVAGVQIHPYWRDLEGDTLGDYSAGFSYLDGVMSSASACGKHVIVTMEVKAFGSAYTSTPSIGVIYVAPQYLASSTYGPCCGTLANGYYLFGGVNLSGTNNGEQQNAAFWYPAVADRIIALVNAYCARYDTNSAFEMFGAFGGETAYGDPTENENLLNSQAKRILDAQAAACPHTMARMSLNFLQTDAGEQLAISNCASEPTCILGGPDPLEAGAGSGVKPSDNSQSLIYAGLECNGCTPHDYRGQVGWIIETQCDMIQWNSNSDHCSGHTIGWGISGGALTQNPQDCAETVLGIREYSEGVGPNVGFGTGVNMNPKEYLWAEWVNCYNPSSPNSGVEQSFTANPSPTSTSCPANFTGGCNTN